MLNDFERFTPFGCIVFAQCLHTGIHSSLDTYRILYFLLSFFLSFFLFIRRFFFVRRAYSQFSGMRVNGGRSFCDIIYLGCTRILIQMMPMMAFVKARFILIIFHIFIHSRFSSHTIKISSRSNTNNKTYR